jgi:hypothetical protein
MLTATPLTREELRAEFESEMMHEVVKASPLKEEKSSSQRNIILIGGFVLAIVVAIILGTVLGTRENKDHDAKAINETQSATPIPGLPTSPPSTASPTAAPTLSSQQLELLEYLTSISSDGGLSLQEKSSPQYRAFLWLSSSKDEFTHPSDQLNEKYAMSTFYYATDGDNWKDNSHWLELDDICDWYSNSPATSCGSARAYQEMELPFNNLRGTLPAELALLTGLTNLNLAGNLLTGTLPSVELGSSGMVSSLRFINLEGNALGGSFASEIGQLTLLQELNIVKNRFNGTLPTEFGNLENLRIFRSEWSGFTGTIPTEVGKLTRLEEWGK